MSSNADSRKIFLTILYIYEAGKDSKCHKVMFWRFTEPNAQAMWSPTSWRSRKHETRQSASPGMGATTPTLVASAFGSVELRNVYKPLSAGATGCRAARIAGKIPPRNPISNAKITPSTSNGGVILKANAR
jgi:hypothetical protein